MFMIYIPFLDNEILLRVSEWWPQERDVPLKRMHNSDLIFTCAMSLTLSRGVKFEVKQNSVQPRYLRFLI